MTKFEKTIFYLIIIQPLLDISTSLTTNLGVTVSGGALFRTLLMGVLFIYIAYVLITLKKRTYFAIFLGSLLALVLMFLINSQLKHPYLLFEEMNFILKTGYFVAMIFFVITLIEKRINLLETIVKAIPIVSLIIGLSYWTAIFTNTNISSYTYDKIGYSGWFYSANELSVIVLILLGLTIVNLNKNSMLINFIAFGLLLSMLPMIGTKTAFIGGIIITIAYGFHLLLSKRASYIQTSFKFAFFSVVALFFIITPFTPIGSNTVNVELNDDYYNYTDIEKTRYDQYRDKNGFLNRILSSRDIYFYATYEDFQQSSPVRKLFGIGYAGNYVTEPKLIEMDFFDLFFSYGYIGSLLLIIPLVILFRKLLVLNSSITYILLQLTLLLSLGIAFLAGHVLFAPSVMTYVTILLLQIASLNHNKLGGTYETE